MTSEPSGPGDPVSLAFAAAPDAGIFGQALFAQSPLSTVVYDTAGRITAANAAFERLFALRVDDIRDRYSILEDVQLAVSGVVARSLYLGDWCDGRIPVLRILGREFLEG